MTDEFALEQLRINRWYGAVSRVYDIMMRFDERRKSRELLISQLEIKNGEHVLEIGAGTGKNIRLYPKDAEIFLFDINPRMISKAVKKSAKQKFNAGGFVLGNARELPFQDSSFDAIVMSYALSAIPGNMKLIPELKRIIRPDGRIGIFDYALSSEFYGLGFAELNLRHFVYLLGMETAYLKKYKSWATIPEQSLYILTN